MFSLESHVLLDIHSGKSLCAAHDEDISEKSPSRSWSPSPSESSAHSSSTTGDEEVIDDCQPPLLYNVPAKDHYEFWDARPLERFCMSGSLYLATDHWEPRASARLEFSHMELEVRTHGRQGRFSRENIWRPAYFDYASTPVTARAAQHLTRTRERSGVTFARLDNRVSEAIRVAYRVEIPQELFWVMKTRSLRITARAIFTEWRGRSVVSAEVVEADPVCVTVSHLQMRDYQSAARWRGPTRCVPRF